MAATREATATAAAVRLGNYTRPDIEAVQVLGARIDVTTPHLWIPEPLAAQLQLREADVREVALAGGRVKAVRYVGPVRLELAGRMCVGGALVGGDQVVIWSIALADLDLAPSSEPGAGWPRSLAVGLQLGNLAGIEASAKWTACPSRASASLQATI